MPLSKSLFHLYLNKYQSLKISNFLLLVNLDSIIRVHTKIKVSSPYFELLKRKSDGLQINPRFSYFSIFFIFYLK